MEENSFHSRHPFHTRHIGISEQDCRLMLSKLCYDSLAKMLDAIIPASLPRVSELELDEPLSEEQLLKTLANISLLNNKAKNYIGLGFSPVHTPAVIVRNVLEDPRWYSSYAPYQAELAQGRLQALLNFQQMVIDLTGLEIANASLLDEASSVAEAMSMAFNYHRKRRGKFFVAEHLYPQSISVLETRAAPLGIELVIGNSSTCTIDKSFCGGVIQYPAANGSIPDLREFCSQLQQAGALSICVADITALLLLPPPAECGADIAVGSTQRFGMPLFFGGPHAAFLACRAKYVRLLAGKLVGVSKDMRGGVALRVALQTREQHIRREKATSNICTSQVLTAIISSFYAVYHGRERLLQKAITLRTKTALLREALLAMGLVVTNKTFFDTLTVGLVGDKREMVLHRASARKINFRTDQEKYIGISLHESTTLADVQEIAIVFEQEKSKQLDWDNLQQIATAQVASMPRRAENFFTHAIFNSYHTETEFVRYATHLAGKDLSLAHSMIPLGSCTMKLNSATELVPVTWSNFSDIHPFAPRQQTAGYQRLLVELEQMLEEISGMDAVSLQPNAGSQGELAGLLAIRRYHFAQGNTDRNICLIPSSAHGTNPASAVMAGFKVVEVCCDKDGSIDLSDLQTHAQKHASQLGALMITYPSTHGVFDENVIDVCRVVHEYGGQVYLDGANMNALVGLVKPCDIGADVMHFNLHKTFCIPHGGGGPGVGPIAVQQHLSPYLPSHFLLQKGETGALTSSPYGSAGVLSISWSYIKMMGAEGLAKASTVAILSANYIAHRLEKHYKILFKGKNGLVAHECIIDFRPFRAKGIDISDIARRLMDYGFHSPTMSWPVAQTLMIEPTESESLAELNRFCEAMIAIRQEIEETSPANVEQSVLRNAPHTLADCMEENWTRSYSKQKAFYPLPYLRERKFWTPVNKIDHAYGDRNLQCACV